jgi:hypothetical protein
MIVTLDSLQILLTNFLFYYTVAFAGAFMKDLYETMTRKNDPIRLGELIVGATCASFIAMSLHETLLSELKLNTILLVTFVLGILGFEIFGNITSISSLEGFATRILEIKDRFSIQYNPPGKEEKKEVETKEQDVEG